MHNTDELKWRINEVICGITAEMLRNVSREYNFRLDTLPARNGAHVEVIQCVTENCLNSACQ